jgi:hypothetical protein
MRAFRRQLLTRLQREERRFAEIKRELRVQRTKLTTSGYTMFTTSFSFRLRTLRAGRRSIKGRRRDFKPATEPLERKQLLAAAIAVSALHQYGIPSVFAIGSTGNLSYNFLTVSTGQLAWNGWSQIPLPGGIPATSISSGTVQTVTSPIPRPYVFMVNSAQDIYYNMANSSGNFSGWAPVGLNVGAVSISSGALPITNTPFVVMINGNHDIYYNSQLSDGAWAGWTPVGVNVGAVSITTGIYQPTLSPAFYEPYVFMTNTAHDVYFKARQANGSWSNWSAVGVNVGAVSISATTISNKPTVSMLNTAGNIYINSQAAPGSWLGWSLVGAGTGSGATPALGSLAIPSSFNIYEFALNSSGAQFSTYGIYGHWSSWFPLESLPSGVSAVALAATSAPTGSPFVFAIGTDGIVYWADQTAWATWSSFASLGAPS